MRHPEFATLGGVTQIGRVYVDNTHSTAGTDGCDVWYGGQFIVDMPRKQLRYLVLHENLHKALHHCTEYIGVAQKHPDIFAQAIDYVVNGTIEHMDPAFAFIERPTKVAPLVRADFSDLSLLEVMRKLLDEQKSGKKPPPNAKDSSPGPGGGTPMDVHIMRKPEDGAADPGEGMPKDAQGNPIPLKMLIADALAHGALAAEQLRGNQPGSGALSGFTERQTDWRPPLRKFIEELCEGDDYSRFNPPNRRMLPLGILMPSHFSEASGDFIIACDTSGSMGGVYPVVFGEIARICQQMQPKLVRIIWWDAKVQAEQTFTTKDYANIAKLMKPAGGGGTTVSCVAQYIKAKSYKPKATIMLTDGYIESNYEAPAGPLLWGVVDNTRFVPLRGKALHISSVGSV